jgi:hypothetical protein
MHTAQRLPRTGLSLFDDRFGDVILWSLRFPPTDRLPDPIDQSRARRGCRHESERHEIRPRTVEVREMRIEGRARLEEPDVRDLRGRNAPPAGRSQGRRGSAAVDCGRGLVDRKTGASTGRLRGSVGRGCPPPPTRGCGLEARGSQSHTGSMKPGRRLGLAPHRCGIGEKAGSLMEHALRKWKCTHCGRDNETVVGLDGTAKCPRCAGTMRVQRSRDYLSSFSTLHPEVGPLGAHRSEPVPTGRPRSGRVSLPSPGLR